MKSKKKKRIGMLLAYCMFILLGVALVSVTSKAAETADGYKYYTWENENGKCAAISGYTGSDTELVIPEEVAGYKVTSIDREAFYDYSSLTSVTIPEGVTDIGYYAFKGCSGLTSITIPEGVTRIKESVFADCSNLTNITIQKGVKYIESCAFYGCSGLTSITIPESVIEIETNAFSRCSNLSEILVEDGNEKYYSAGNCIMTKDNKLILGCKTSDIPKEVISIEADAFLGCSNLTSITIPEKVTEIGIAAFADCSNLTSITIPEGITRIRASVFAGCSNLKSITIPASVVTVEGNAFSGTAWLENMKKNSNDGLVIVNNLLIDGSNATGDVVIPESVTEIGRGAFEYCINLTSIIIPESVTKIGDDAFSWCSGLTSIVIPESVTEIGRGAFERCSGLTSVVISNSVTKIKYNTFLYCSSLTSVTIPRSVTSIDEGDEDAFYGVNENLIVHAAPGSYAVMWAEKKGYKVETINEGREFEEGGNKYQYQILSDGTVEIIGYGGTEKNLEIPASIDNKAVTSIRKFTFSGCNIQNITIPSSVTNIEYGALVGLSNLVGITVAEGNEYYYSSGNCLISKEGELIAGCKKSVIPTGVKSIGKHAFRGCHFNYDFVIPNGVAYIGDYSFDDSSLSNISIPSSVISIGQGTIGYNYINDDGDRIVTCIHAVPGSYAAEWAKKNDYDLMSLSQTYEDGDGTYEYTVLDDGTIRIDACFSEQEEIEVPAMIDGKTVTSIGRRAFTECEYYLTSISIPDSVTSIGEYAFSECISLSYVNISSSSNLTSIGDYAFAVCDNIETITIPDGVTSIGEGAFSDCESLTSIVIPNGVTNIEKNTFNSCCSLESVSLPASMTNIGEAAFSGCDRLESITLPEGLKTIAKDTFSCCAGLTGITIPSTVTSIGEAAFSGCSGLTNIMIPASVTNINKAAFDGCMGLTGVEVAEENEVYYSEQNCIIRKDNSELVLGCKNSIIPNNVKSIGACAFSGCMNLRSIAIPDGVISIGDCAFSNCKGLTSITIPDSVVNFGEYAIDGNEDDFVIYASADSVAAKWAKENGFDVSSPKDDGPSGGNDNPGMDNPSGGNDNPGTNNPSGGNDNPEINNPSGGNTGNGTKTDTTTPVGTTPAAVGTVLKGVVANASVTVTSDQEGNPTVEYTAVINKKAKAVTIPNSVTVDGITYKVTSVSAKAFAGCKKATKITIGANVTSIGKNAFKDCKAVKTITIKSTKLAKNAFAKAGVKKLSKKVTIKVPKSCKKDYKKQLEKAGFKGKIK